MAATSPKRTPRKTYTCPACGNPLDNREDFLGTREDWIGDEVVKVHIFRCRVCSPPGTGLPKRFEVPA